MLDITRFILAKFPSQKKEEQFLKSFFDRNIHFARLALMINYIVLTFPIIFKFNKNIVSDNFPYIIIYILLFFVTFMIIVFTYNKGYSKHYLKINSYIVSFYLIFLAIIAFLNISSKELFYSAICSAIIILIVSNISFEFNMINTIMTSLIGIMAFNIVSLIGFIRNNSLNEVNIFLYLNTIFIVVTGFVVLYNIYTSNQERRNFDFKYFSDEQSKLFKTAFNTYKEGILLLKDDKIIEANNRILEMLKINKDDIVGSGVNNYITEKSSVENELVEGVLITKTNQFIEIEIHKKSENGFEMYSIIDISEQKNMEEKYRLLYQESSAIHIVIDSHFIIEDINQTTEKVLGFTEIELIDNEMSQIIYEEDIKKFEMEVENIFLGMVNNEGLEIRFLDSNNQIKYCLLYFSNLMFNKRNNYKIYINGVDITERKKNEEKLNKYATMDAMTEVLNRRMGLEKLNEAKKNADENGEIFSICFVDINNLKRVNDVYGHNEGDELIKVVGEAIKTSLRNFDSIARMGGDEFLLILPKFKEEKGSIIWNRIQEILDEISGIKPYDITASYDFVEYNPEDPESIEGLIERADNKMYEQKSDKKKEAAYKGLDEIKKELNNS